jgi:hypothetical protein
MYRYMLYHACFFRQWWLHPDYYYDFEDVLHRQKTYLLRFTTDEHQEIAAVYLTMIRLTSSAVNACGNMAGTSLH